VVIEVIAEKASLDGSSERCHDLTCRFPGYDAPAEVCDIDDTIPYPLGSAYAAADPSSEQRPATIALRVSST
jgi:hypothetical protein